MVAFHLRMAEEILGTSLNSKMLLDRTRRFFDTDEKCINLKNHTAPVLAVPVFVSPEYLIDTVS